MEVLERMPFEKRNFIFTKLAEIAEVRKLSPDERVAYDQSLKHYRDTTNIFATAIGDTRAEALAEGEAIGEVKKAKAIALQMLLAGMEYKTVMQFTGLTEDEVKSLMPKGGN